MRNRSALMSVKRGANHLNVSAFSLYRKLKTGELPGYRFGRRVLLDLDEVLSAMRQAASKTSHLGENMKFH